MSIITKYMTANPYYNDGKYLSGTAFKGFFLHSVGCPQESPLVFWNSFNKSSYYTAAVNGFIGADTTYITMPTFETPGKVKRAPHAGSPANNNYVGFEMCEPKTIKYTSGSNFTCSDYAEARAFTTKVYDNAVELFAKLCSFHGKDPTASGVIYSHREGAAAGIATNHGDPEHLWKGLGLSYTMDGFRKDVKAKMSGGSVSTPTTSTATTTSVNYKAVTTAVLNCRSGASTSYGVVKVYAKGTTVTITKEYDGWGYTGTGWISLQYVSKVTSTTTSTTTTSSTSTMYRVCTSYSGGKYIGQIGAYTNLTNAKAACKFGYWIYDQNGKCVWPYDTSYSKTYTVTASSGLNVRSGCGTGYSVKTTVPYGSKVSCYGYYQKDSAGTTWLYIVTSGGVYGYVSKAYLK